MLRSIVAFTSGAVPGSAAGAFALAWLQVTRATTTAADAVPAIIGRFQRNLDAFNAEAQLPYRLSVSVGVILYDPVRRLPLDELLAEADRLMYEQKRRKRGPA